MFDFNAFWLVLWVSFFKETPIFMGEKKYIHGNSERALVVFVLRFCLKIDMMRLLIDSRAEFLLSTVWNIRFMDLHRGFLRWRY